MLSVGKDLILVRQIGAAGIDEIDAGQIVFPRDLLCAQMFFDRQRIIRAALHRRIVSNDDAFAPSNAADAGQDAGGGDRLVIDIVRGKLREFEIRRAGIEQRAHAIAR